MIHRRNIQLPNYAIIIRHLCNLINWCNGYTELNWLIVGLIERRLVLYGSFLCFELQLIPLEAEGIVLQPLQFLDGKVYVFQKVYRATHNIRHWCACAGQDTQLDLEGRLGVNTRNNRSHATYFCRSRSKPSLCRNMLSRVGHSSCTVCWSQSMLQIDRIWICIIYEYDSNVVTHDCPWHCTPSSVADNCASREELLHMHTIRPITIENQDGIYNYYYLYYP